MKQYQIDRIRDLMEAKGITTKALASMCDISAMTINRLLSNPAYNPTTDTVEKIAEALGMHEQYIYEAEADTRSRMPINGYVEYDGTVYPVKTIAQLKRLYEVVKKDEAIPSLIKQVKAQDAANQKTQSKEPIDIGSIDFFKPEQYDTSQLYTWGFRKSDDEKEEVANDLGNMCKGYPFKVHGETFLNSECAYISGLFSQDTSKAVEIQRELQASDNGYEAKKSIRRKYEQVGLGRDDWESFNVHWMLYVVWQKVKQNKEFAKKLRKIPPYAMIVENSTFQKGETSTFWGMKNDAIREATEVMERAAEMANANAPRRVVDEARMRARNCINHVGTWEGVNCMGKILTICKHCLENGMEPPIDYDLLRSKKIHLFGKLLTFDDEAAPSRYTAIFFDFDGTLLDTRPWQEYEYLFKEPKQGSEEWKKGRKEYLRHVIDCQQWEGMDEVLEYIRQHHIRICVVSANTKDRVEAAIKTFGWADIIEKDNIFGCYALGRKRASKDDGAPSLFIKAMEVLGVEPNECVAFGNELNDTKAAQNAGLAAYNCLWGAAEDEAQTMTETMPTISLNAPADIIEILR